jgi:hypothetical protein
MDGRCRKDAALSARGWKSPLPVRLRRIEKWRKARYERMLDGVKNDDDRRKAYRAATLYTEVSCRLDGLALGAITSYRAGPKA